MSLTVEVYYSFQSPYSYLALDHIYQLESTYDLELLWQPYSAKAAGQVLPPAAIIPDKLSYLFEDTQRLSKELNIPVKFPEGWPETEFDPGRVTRGAVVASDLGILKEYNYKVFMRWWGEGENPNDENFMNELCDELDINLGDFLSKVSSSDTRERVKGIYKRGKKIGVFDTPTFVIENERIFGIDKIPYLSARFDKQGLRRTKS
ncbi:MAG: DsbA family protein [Oligoflexia bacterium]|nr:DsbA family protein [Oligoflexia bacterium]